MSQEYKTAVKRPRRTRIPRHRPVLVNGSDTLTATATEAEEQVASPTTEDLALDASTTTEQDTPVTPAEQPKRPLRLPNFFTKTEQEVAPSEQDIVDARMARARKSSNGTAAATSANKTEGKASAKPATSAKAQPARRPGLFKPRHIIGLIIYMLVANFVLTFEQTLTVSAGIERNLFEVPGVNLPVSTSVLLNIVTLIVVLYLMVAFDLLPNGKQYARQQAVANRQNGARGSVQNPARPKQIPPAVRQGVQGQDDDLYQAYRQGQRNKKR
jgi:hypothetical protein